MPFPAFAEKMCLGAIRKKQTKKKKKKRKKTQASLKCFGFSGVCI